MKKLAAIAMSKIIWVLLLSMFLVISNTLAAQNYDPGFGNDGIVSYRYYCCGVFYNSHFRSMAIQQDGKIVVSQNSDQYRVSDKYYSMLRYNSNGALDSSFGINGQATNSYNATNILLLPDGKILNSGKRYYQNGSVDSTYGIDGSSVGGFSGLVTALQKDGKVISGGGDEYASAAYKFSRYKVDGFLDSTFGINGTVSTTFISNDNASSIAIQEDGKIVAGGTTRYAYGVAFALARYNTDGSPDVNFGKNGKVIVFNNENPSGSLYCYCKAIALQNDGKIVATGFILGSGGSHDTLADQHFFTMRFNAEGAIDSSFGSDGQVITSVDNGSDFAYDLVIQTDGKILVTGSGSAAVGMAIVRYNTDGSLDSTFENGGKLTSNRFGAGQSIKLQTDGKILIGGGTTVTVVIARFDTVGVLPVKLLSFTVAKKGKTVLLNWQTTAETNNAYFFVERSANGNSNFFAIGKISSNGNGAQLQQYAFEDLSPLTGGNYYRLKQVDKDGRSSYSKTIFIAFTKNATVKIYPNPVKDMLQIDGLDASVKTNISICDLSGRVLANTSINGSSYSWNIKQLPSGSYYLIIDVAKKITTLKFIKN